MTTKPKKKKTYRICGTKGCPTNRKRQTPSAAEQRRAGLITCGGNPRRKSVKHGKGKGRRGKRRGGGRSKRRRGSRRRSRSKKGGSRSSVSQTASAEA